MKGVIKIFSLILGMSLCVQLSAQDPDLPSEEVDIIKSFDARLGDAERVNLDPSLPPLDTATRRLNYNVFTRTIPVEYLPPKIRPLALRREKNQEAYDGYLKLGGGFPGTFFGEGFYGLSNNENFNLDIFANHHSANNGQRVENQKFSLTNVGLDGTYYSKDKGYAVNGGLGYTRDAVFFYGYNEVGELLEREFSFEPEEVKQRFATVDGHLNIFNGARTEADFNYYAGVDFYLLNDNYAARENGFNLLLSGTKWFNEKHPLVIELETDFTSFRDTATQNLNNFFLRPSYTHHGDRFKAKIGAIVASNDDEFTFFPDLELSAMIIDGNLSAYVGATGSLNKNSFRVLTDYNPFLSSRILIRNSRFYEYYGGVRGNIEGIDYDAQVAYKTVDNLALFLLPDVFDTIPRFDVLYDTGTVVTIKGSLTAPIFEGFEVTGAISQNFYSLDGQEEPWHLPALTVNLGARYRTMEDQLVLKGEFFLENGVPYLDDDGVAQTLNTLFDISVGAEYYFTENIGGFVQINNLANNRRQRWQHYPIFGINAMIGVMARF
jgi:hypothetical protein